MKLTIYEYPKCGTCREAIKLLEAHDINLERINIFEHPPEFSVMKNLIEKSGLPLSRFFNTSGLVYKEQNLKEKLPLMNEEEKIKLLASNGRLIKRPIITDGHKVTVGFKEEEIREVWTTK